MTVDDAASALLRFESGSARHDGDGARAAVRRPCDFTVEANGSYGTLMFDYARLNELWYASAHDDARLYGMRRIRAEHPGHPYAAQWWPIGQGVGYGSRRSRTRSPTCSKAGPRHHGRRSSAKARPCRRSATRWRPRPRPAAG